MNWQWVTVLAIVVAAWTVHKVTQMWQNYLIYRYAPDEVKNAMWDLTQKSENGL